MTEDSTKDVERARELYANDELEIDDNAIISQADDGCWVAAWVWVPVDSD
jgi:hypothetical protein